MEKKDITQFTMGSVHRLVSWLNSLVIKAIISGSEQSDAEICLFDRNRFPVYLRKLNDDEPDPNSLPV